MEKIPGYQLMNQKIEGENWRLYRAFSKDDQRVVGVKEIINSFSTEYAVAETIHEYHLTKGLCDIAILHPERLERVGDKAFIITDYVDGNTLMDCLSKNGAMDIPTFLRMAIQLATNVEKVHQKHIIHKSLHPKNILLESKTNQIILTAFYQSTTLTNERPFPHISPYQLKGKVAYMSPEQTGRMNRNMDYRTDLYALGVIYYEMITGKLPFDLSNPSEMIHAHIAKKPKPPNEIHVNIPKIISDIILKLMAKNPDERYQSVSSLRLDLQKCFKELHQRGVIESFELDTHSQKRMLDKPSKLYGRNEAIRKVIQKFDDVQRGSKEFILVPGPSGMGKTALVHEIHKPLVRNSGYFISGKFVKLKNQVPYSPLIEAFQGLINQVLTEGADRIEKWKRLVESELGAYARVIASFVPEIKWIIGSQPSLPDLPPQGVHNRFRQAIKKFVSVFAQKEHPLVLFIDDLQWADAATLELLDYLLSNSDIQHVLVIGAYRQDEIEFGHPFEAMRAKLAEKTIHAVEIPVTPLQSEDIRQWVNESLSANEEDEDFIVAFMTRVTKGNPLYMVQLFQALHDESILFFESSTANWKADLTRLKQLSINDSIVAFMIKRMEKLENDTKSILQYAACFGNQFDLKSLALLTGNNYVETARMLWEGLNEGLIIPIDPSYKWVYPDEGMSFIDSNPPTYMFLHDKVQQAFYMTLSEQKRLETHLNIGKELVQRYSNEKIEDHIFEIVNHLNISRDQLSDQDRFDLIDWNYAAGERAKKSAAFKAALEFFRIGHELLPDDSWKRHYETTFNVLLGLGETLYLNHLFEDAEKIFDELLDQANSRYDQLTVYNLKINLYTHIHEVEKAVDTGLEGMKLFGWKIRKNPSKLAVGMELLRTKLALGKKSTDDLLALPPVQEKDHRQAMRTLINSNGPAYHVNQNLATVFMLRAIRFMLKYGDMDVSALVYNNYALTLSAGFHDYEGSSRFGKLAIQHTEKYQDTSLKARVNFVYGSFVSHWKQHVKYNVDYLERSQQMCVESGNLHLAGAAGAFIGLLHYMKGDKLGDVKKGIDRQLAFAKQNEYVLTDNFLSEITSWIEILSKKDSPIIWDYPDFEEDIPATIMHYTIRLQMTYLFGAEQEAKKIMQKVDHLVHQTHVLLITPDYYYYHGLWVTKLLQNQLIKRSVGRKLIKRDLAKLRKWARQSPSNYNHKYLLVKAEWDRLAKKDPIADYNKSVEAAIENGFLQDIAIANECAGNYFQRKNIKTVATTYLTEAYAAYRNWGAERKAFLLHQDNKEFIDRRKKSAEGNGEGLIDTQAALRAAAAISDEIKLDQVLAKLMDIVLQNAGAEYGCLVLKRDQRLQVAASNDTTNGVQVFEKLKQIEHVALPLSIVTYVDQRQKAVVLDDVIHQGDFAHDQYIKRKRAKSVLCMPILYQNQLTGILYLENNQSTHVFTHDRMEFLTVIASQAAIAIENANLYANLEEKVAKRTELLYEANINLQQANESLATSEENRRRLVSNITHDLRSPLATVKGYMDILLDGFIDRPEQQQQYLRAAKSRLISLDGLVQDLFDLAKLESGDISLGLEVLSIDKLFHHLCSHVEWEIQKAGLDAVREIKCDNKDSPLVEVDVTRLEQVMTNLVSNAIQHMEHGKIYMILDRKDKQEVTIAIKDEGVGIPESEQSLIFDRSYTNRRLTKEKGNGLGLAITKEIIQLHNGKIWVESKAGEGATFFFTIPVVEFASEPIVQSIYTKMH
ncbi:Predicted ATPase [Oceanobacillus limi]|uniref:histidine kinase n=1 Tax=Oceanobacillus limi TaxID=930131 RepID=A0A1I0BGU9_9BACI|nr:ATP-binding sensor histidine kinase [Oceanobacillus limi]SET05812.1 Predicted ATPase [Oceanobacillus limi]